MKKNILLGLILMAAFSLYAERVPVENARKAATTFLSNNGVKSNQLIDLSKAAGFPNLYIFNAEKGFVVMSADDCVKPILGYSLTEGLDVDNMPKDMVWWLQGYNDQIQELIDKSSKATSSTTKQWNDLITGSAGEAKTRAEVGPFISTKWDQTYPYNYYCPTCSSGGSSGHVYTGCVATAMAQVLKYHNHPTQGIGSHSYTHNVYGLQTANFGETSYNWNQMPSQIYSSSNTTQKEAVAKLIYHCGVAVDMNYGNDGSGAHSNDIAPALIKYFNYSQSTTFVERSEYSNDAWINLMRSELNASRPVVYGGMDSETNPQSGHSFVCDGYGKDGYSNYYFHFNWGWSGSYNNYFSIDQMTPGGSGAGGGNHNYSFLQDAVIGITPSTNTTAPTNLTYAIEGTTLSLSWSCNGNVSSYNVYCNNVLIGNVSTTSYTGPVSYGSNTYYVQSVNASGDFSLASNSIIIQVDYPTPVVNDLTATLTNNSVSLSWTAPDWCYPETPSATLTYGDGIYSNSLGTNGQANMYWAQRFPKENLTASQGMIIYKISFYVSVAGAYECMVYKGSNNGPTPKTHLATFNVNPTAKGWFDIVLDNPLEIDHTQDLWVILHDTEYKGHPASFCYFTEHNEGSYVATANISDLIAYGNNISWLIQTYLTDGAYTYNLYDGTTRVNGNVPITGTSYTVDNLSSNASHHFTVKTNYYGGETTASNMVGVTLGSAEVTDLSLDDDDKMTLTEGSTLTVTGTLTNTDPAHLVIEDGAQLIHPNSAVQATLNKTILPYTAGVSDGWYTIASPVDEYSVTNITNGNYDLYAYDEEDLVWRNQKTTANNITQFTEGTGFLYANATTQPLSFIGKMKATDEQVALTLSCKSDHAKLKGINLVGNPFTRNLEYGDILLGTEPLTTYYSVEGGTELVSHEIDTDPIKPGQGFLVQASEDGQSLVFNPASSKELTALKPSYICIEAGDGYFSDRIYVQFDKGNVLHKMTLGDNTARLSALHHHDEYATVTVNTSENTLPIRFKAAYDGTYTLTVTASINYDFLVLDYLHLIDHLTGADIDLLQTPSYSFEAKTDDYTARFQLVFRENTDENSLFNGIDFVDGKTQILDMTGRVVATNPNTRLAPGVYLLRTINGNDIKTEKIIIK